MSAGAGPRELAREVLAEDRFQRNDVPQPLREPLRELGELLLRPFDWALGWLPGGDVVTWAVAGALVLAAAAVLAARQARRQVERSARVRRAEAADRVRAADLRDRARAAERAGDLDAALRLHFLAGLTELDEAGLITLDPGRSNGQIVGGTRSHTLRELTATFERVAYGGRPADAADLDAVRDRWPRVRQEVGTA